MSQAPPVFWAEADDDASRLTQIPDLARLSLVAYLLMGRTVIAHPAYTWQSDTAREIILPEHHAPRLELPLRLVLGDSPTVEDYIKDRIRKLGAGGRRHAGFQAELNQYLRYPSLVAEAHRLDERFVAPGAVQSIGWSRDAKFRRLIQDDLQNQIPFGEHLRALVFRYTGSVCRDLVIDRLYKMTERRDRFVSVDSVVRTAVKNGFPKEFTFSMDARLHVLHWMAHESNGMHIPLLSRTDRRRLNAADPIVFWHLVDRTFRCELSGAVRRMPWGDAQRFIDRLRSDILWGEFVDKYHRSVIDIVDTESDIFDDGTAHRELCRKYPTLAGTLMQMPISKLGWLSIVCTLMGLGGNNDIVTALGTVGTLGDAVVVSVRHLKQYYVGGRGALRERILQLLRGAGND